MTCPNKERVLPGSMGESPVTQTALVAKKRASSHARRPVSEDIGNAKSNAPDAMTTAKLRMTKCEGESDKPFRTITDFSRFQTSTATVAWLW